MTTQITIMITTLGLALIMLAVLIAFFKWHVNVSNIHARMTPEQIIESRKYFKIVLPLLNIIQMLKCFTRLLNKKGEDP